MNKFFSLASICLLLSACQQDRSSVLEQHWCKALTTAYLGIDTKKNYQLWKIEQTQNHAQELQLKLFYQQPNEYGVTIPHSLQPQLVLICQREQQMLSLSKLTDDGRSQLLLRLQLPPEEIHHTQVSNP